VLAGAAATGLAAGALPLIGGASRAHASEPQRGGTLRMGFGHGSTTDSLDPGSWEHAYVGSLGLGGIHGYVTQIDENNQLEPGLATEWEAGEGGAVWTFVLRDGVEFHNGKSLTADDVVAAMNHHRGPDSTSAISSLFEQVTEITADGNTVIFTLNAPNADFPFILSDYHAPVTPSDGEGNADVVSGIGAGSYVLDSYEPGISAFLHRNPNYWRSDRGWFEHVEMHTIGDVSARMNALMTGQMDVIDRVDLKTAHLLEQNPEIELVEVVGTLHYTFPMRCDMAPFDDSNVRMAIKHGINRADVLDKILRGHGVIGNDQPIAPANRYYAADVEPLPYDPEKARWYLKQSGHDSLRVDLSSAEAAFVGATDSAVMFKEHLAPAGIEVNVVRESSDGYWSDVWMVKPWCASYWSGRTTEDWMFSTAYSADAPWNETFWKNEHFNRLLIQARAELDENVRREMYREMQMLIRDDGGALMPMFANNVDAASIQLGHQAAMAGNYNMDGGRLMERWWFVDPAA